MALVSTTSAELLKAYSEHEKKVIQSAKSGSCRQLIVKGAMLNILVDTEVRMWFYIGERIGKRGTIGDAGNI